jgi:hypothetical protein
MLRKSALPLIALAYLAAFCWFGQWKSVFYRSDSWGYYLHLPATLLYHDAGDYSATLAAWRAYNPGEADPRADAYGLRTAPATGRTVIKYPVGPALLQSPFFLLAHGWCKATGQFPADGFSTPYILLAGLSTLFYALWGLYFLEKTLRRFFSAPVAQVTLAVVALATNLFFFSTYTVGMAHPYLFFGWSLLLWTVSLKFEVREFEVPTRRPELQTSNSRTSNFKLSNFKLSNFKLSNFKLSNFKLSNFKLSNFKLSNFKLSNFKLSNFKLGAALGLIAICRVPEALALLTPLLWGLGSGHSVSERLQFLWEKKRSVAAVLLAFGLSVLPQLAYWKFVSGQWFFNSYQGERFHWAEPQLLNGLFHYQNGWLIYTPVMALALLGLLWLRRFAAAAFWPVAAVLPLHLYVIYSWWCWQYINGFGSRPMVDVYPLLALPLAATVATAWQRSWSRWLLSAALLGCAALNLFQTWQTERLILWTERANAAYYAAVFGKTAVTRAAYLALESGQKQPDETQIQRVKTLFFNEIPDSTEEYHRVRASHSPPYSFRCTNEFCFTGTVPTDTADLRPGDWLRVSVWAFMRPDERERRLDYLARLALEINGPDGARIGYGSISVTSKIGNPQHSYWHGGTTGEWGEAAFFLQIPAGYCSGGNLKAYVWNGRGQKLYLDDLRVEVWR